MIRHLSAVDNLVFRRDDLHFVIKSVIPVASLRQVPSRPARRCSPGRYRSAAGERANLVRHIGRADRQEAEETTDAAAYLMSSCTDYWRVIMDSRTFI